MSNDLFDRLASLADADHVPDRLYGVRTKARAMRRRRRAGVATTAVALLVAGGFGAMHLRDGGSHVNEPPVATRSPDPGPKVEIRATSLDATHFRLVYTVRGTAHAFVPGQGKIVPMLPGQRGIDDSAMLAGTRVTVDGEDQLGSDGGDVVCVSDSPTASFEATWGDSANREEQIVVEVPGAGTYDVRVEATYCGANGTLQTAASRVQVTTEDQVGEETASTEADIDGDGRIDQVRATQVANEGTGESDNNSIVVTTATGASASVSTGSGFALTGLETVQLDAGGMEIVAVPDGGDRVPTYVATFVDGRGLVLVKPIEGDLVSVPVPRLRVTAALRGSLLTIESTKPTGALDPRSQNPVTVSRWMLDSDALGLRSQPVAGQCIVGTDWRTVRQCD